MKTLKASVISLCMLMGSAVFAQDFDSYDDDSDNRISQEEFEEINNNTFYNYDDDANGNISNEEFFQASFAEFDSDGDGIINEEEWKTGINHNAGSFGTEDFSTFDTNVDGSLDEDEWNDGMRLSNEWYDTFDYNTDGNISNEEWNESNFDKWDANDDEFIDENEFSMNNRNE